MPLEFKNLSSPARVASSAGVASGSNLAGGASAAAAPAHTASSSPLQPRASTSSLAGSPPTASGAVAVAVAGTGAGAGSGSLPLLHKGYLRRKSYHLGAWRKRYLVLTTSGLDVYTYPTDDAPSKHMPLAGNTRVADMETTTVRGSTGFSHPNQTVFSVLLPDGFKEWFASETQAEADAWKRAIETHFSAASPAMMTSGLPASALRPSSLASGVASKDKDATASANGNGNGNANANASETETRNVTFDASADSVSAADPRHEERMRAKVAKRENIKRQLLRAASVGNVVPSNSLKKTLELISRAAWREVMVTNGMRVMAEVGLTKEYPCLRVSCVLPAPPDRAFELLSDLKSVTLWDGLVESVAQLDVGDDGHFRKIHVKNRALASQGFGPFSAYPRDYVLNSSWRRDDDGSYVILEQSDETYPHEPGYVRARIFAQGWTICPRRAARKKRVVVSSGGGGVGGASDEFEEENFADEDDEVGGAAAAVPSNDCLLQLAIHADMGGWMGAVSRQWTQEWVCAMVLRVVGLREALEVEQFRAVDFASLTMKPAGSASLGKRAGGEEGAGSPLRRGASAVVPTDVASGGAPSTSPPRTEAEKEMEKERNRPTPRILVPKHSDATIATWSTIPPTNWRNATQPYKLRGKTYLIDKVKVDCEQPMFDAAALDLFEVPEGVDISAVDIPNGVARRILGDPSATSSSSPNPNANAGQGRDGMPSSRFLFIVHFQIPGPPNMSFILYFLARPGVLEGSSAFSDLFGDFVDGDDAYRDSRFKLIPRVVAGPYLVKSAVGSTPAILGKKIAQSYRHGPGFMEVVVDLSSSSVAGGIIRLVKGYTKNITVDLAFLIEAQKDNELPEALLGAMQFENIDLQWAKPLPG